MDYTKFRDWAALAKEGKGIPEGYVYVGLGQVNPNLSAIFGPIRFCKGKFGTRWSSRSDEDYLGTGELDHYAVTIANWERVTKLNYEKTMTAGTFKGFWIKATPALREIFKEIAEEKKCLLHGLEDEVLYVEKNGLGNWIVASISDSKYTRHLTEATRKEFIDFLEAFEGKPKNKTLQLPGLDVEISGEEIKAGCQTYNSDAIETIVRNIQQWLKGVDIQISGLKSIHADMTGIFVDGMKVSFEDFAKIVAEYKSFKK